MLTQYSQRVALSRESAVAFSPPAWSPLRYFPPRAHIAILLRSQNSNRNWTGTELLHTTAVSSPTHQYFPCESKQTRHSDTYFSMQSGGYIVKLMLLCWFYWGSFLGNIKIISVFSNDLIISGIIKITGRSEFECVPLVMKIVSDVCLTTRWSLPSTDPW